MMRVLFTQYLAPDGRKKPVYIERPRSVFEKASDIVAKGFRLECEVLIGDLVSLTIAGDDEDLAIEVVPNGPGVPEAVDKLILGFDIASALDRR